MLRMPLTALRETAVAAAEEEEEEEEVEAAAALDDAPAALRSDEGAQAVRPTSAARTIAGASPPASPPLPPPLD